MVGIENNDELSGDDVEREIVENENNAFEVSPEQATSFDNPGLFNRKRVLIALSVFFALLVCGGLLVNIANKGEKRVQVEEEVRAGDASSSSFLASLRDQAVRRQPIAAEAAVPNVEVEQAVEDEPLLPPVSISRSANVESVRASPPPSVSGDQSSAPAAQGPDMTPVYRSSLVPPVEGSLFTGSRQQQASYNNAPTGNAAADEYYRSALAARNAASGAYGNQASEYTLQNNQDNKQSFYDSSYDESGIMSGRFLGENSVWIGTIIPGILETAINTDLPGNALARVTRNIYDSQTGRKLLIPQGTILIAQYNSSVSYAQRRVQIVWDILVRPDGYQLTLEGMNSVDKLGMSGQNAVYHENWFEYLKAAGIITMFSLANARMTETAAKYANDTAASAVAGANSDFVNQLGGNMVGRAMNIQPTLTVSSGTIINIMLNKSLYLPPVDGFSVTQKYTLE